MMKKPIRQGKLDSIHYLSSLTKDHSQFSTKIAIITLAKKNYSKGFEIILVLMEYLQLISQTTSFISHFYQDFNLDDNFLYRFVVYACELVDPASWFYFGANTNSFKIIFSVFVISIILKYLIFLYVLTISKFSFKSSDLLVELWRFIFKIQARVLCFFTTSLFFRIISTPSQEEFNIFGIGKASLLIICILMIVLEYALSILLQTFFCYVLPSKSFLACKNNGIEVLVLLQKLIFQILQIVLIPSLISTNWILVALNLLFSLVREGYYYASLPLYRPKGLLYQAGLSMVVTSLHLSCFSGLSSRSAGYETEMNFILITWIILSILFIKLSDAYLKKVMIDLIKASNGTPEYLVHKISIIKYWKKQKGLPSSQTQKYGFYYLLDAAVNSCIQTILQVNSNAFKETRYDMDSKEFLSKLFCIYLENLVIKFPKSGFLKLHSAYFYARKVENLTAAVKIIENIKQSYSEKLKLNTCVLTYEMQNGLSMRSKLKAEGDYIDLPEYFKNVTKVAQLKLKMLEQSEAQSEIFQGILSDVPNLQNIYKLGQIVNNHMSDIQKEINQTVEIVPDSYTELLLIYAYYSLSLNHSPKDYLSYLKKFCQKYDKYEKFLKSDELSEQNLYQDTNTLILISAQKGDAGKILFCSKSIEKLYGNSANSYIGTNLSSLAPPSLQSIYAGYFKTLAEKGGSSNIRRVTRGFGQHHKGYLVQIDYYVDFYPFITQEFCLSVIVRPVPPTKDYLILLEDGSIECGSEKVSKRLGLHNNQDPSSITNVKLISEELALINHVFNMKAFPEKYKHSGDEDSATAKGPTSKGSTLFKHASSKKIAEFPVNKDKAKEVYFIFSTKGNILKLNSLNKKSPHLFRCTVKNNFFGSAFIKVVTLEETDEYNEEEESSQNNIILEKTKETHEHNVIEENGNKTDGKNSSDSELRPPDEKENDWLNFKESSNLKPYKLIYNPSVYENISTMNNDKLATTEEHLVEASVIQKTTAFSQVQRISKTHKAIDLVSRSPKKMPEREFDTKRSFKNPESLTMSQRSRSSNQRNVSSAFKAALAIKYSPIFLKVIYFLFYMLIIWIFFSQFNLKDILDQALTFIKTSKEIVKNAEMRNFLLVTIQQTCRLVWDLAIGVLNARNMGIFYRGTQFYVSLLSVFIIKLGNTNKDLFSSANSLQEETRETLFMKDVKIYEAYFDEPNQAFDIFDNFQATSKLVETGLKGINIMKKNVINSKKELYFLLRNTVNDLLVRNEMTSDTIMEYLKFKQIDIYKMVDIYLIFAICVLGISTILFIWAIWYQYRTEKFNMLAIVKLDRSQIKLTLDRINEFKRILENEKNCQEILNIDFETQMNPLNAKPPKENRKNENFKTPRITGIRNKYCIYGLSLLILIASFAGLSLWAAISHKNSLEYFQKKQDQFFFINRLKTQLNLGATMPIELFAGNGTTLTHNRPNSEEFARTIATINKMKNNIQKVFMNEDGNYDPQIKDILFRDGCPYLNKDSEFFCTALKASGSKPGLVFILSDLQTILQEINENFKNSNKTSVSLTVLEAKSFSSTILPYYVSMGECDAISLIIGQIMENDISTMLHKKSLNFGIFSSIFVLLSILIWVLVINPLQEVVNRFKKILRAFPADLILSSFILKSFLIKTSGDALNSIKNDL